MVPSREEIVALRWRRLCRKLPTADWELVPRQGQLGRWPLSTPPRWTSKWCPSCLKSVHQNDFCPIHAQCRWCCACQPIPLPDKALRAPLNPWNAFQHQLKGSQLSKDEVLRQYYAWKEMTADKGEEEIDRVKAPGNTTSFGEEAVYCPDCKMWLNGPPQWEDHQLGKKHLKSIQRASGSG